MRGLRDDKDLKGVTIPGELGQGTQQHKVSAFADDVNAYCADVEDAAKLVQDPRRVVQQYQRASRQRVSIEKLSITLLGKMTSAVLPDIPVKAWVRYGADEADKCLGIRVGTPYQVGGQWFEKAAEVEQLATDVAAGRRLGGAIYARSTLAKGAFASKIFHTFIVQSPYQGARDQVIKSLQNTINSLVFGGFYNVSVETAQQPPCDAGVGHLNVKRRLEAEWAHLASYLMSSAAAAWKNIWWYELRNVYGNLCDPDLLQTACTYRRLQLEAGPSQVMQQAMAGWGKLASKLTPARYVMPELSAHGQRKHDLAIFDGEPIKTQKEWQPFTRKDMIGALVADQRLWFNTSLQSHTPSRMFAPSTFDTEGEAIAWSQAGLNRLVHVINGTQIQGSTSFTNKHPTLDASLVGDLRTALQAASWQDALKDATHMDPSTSQVPRAPLDVDAEGKQQHLAVQYTDTLVSRPITPLIKLRVSHIHTAFTAAAFSMPRVFDPTRGAHARHLHLFAHISPEGRKRHIAQAVSRVCHPAVPPEMTETAYDVMMSGFAWGPSKRSISHVDTCPCGLAAETVEPSLVFIPERLRYA